MIATVYARDQIIGHAELQPGDESMGHIYGTLITNNQYENIRDIVRRFSSYPGRHYPEWYSLRLSVQLGNGYILSPAGGIEICDNEAFPAESLRIDIAGVDCEVIDTYIKR